MMWCLSIADKETSRMSRTCSNEPNCIHHVFRTPRSFARPVSLAAILLVGAIGSEAFAQDETPDVQTADVGDSGPMTQGLSWNLLGGGVPPGGSLVEAAMGFTALPRIAFHHSMSRSFSIGGMFSFDYGYWTPDLAFTPSILLQAPMRLSLSDASNLSMGLRLDPGLGFSFPRGGFMFSVLLNVGFNVGVPIQNRFLVGGGVDLPFAILIGGGRTGVAIPILFGPIFEFHVTPPLAITFDMKFGPAIYAGDGSAVAFGMKLLTGIAYRF